MSKLTLLMRTAMRNPLEAYDRIRTVIEVQTESRGDASRLYRPAPFLDVMRELARFTDPGVGAILQEPGLRRVGEEIEEKAARLPTEAPFTRLHDADPDLARMCYVLTRLMRPIVVLETGVAFGITTAYLLQALEANAQGELHSIDLPPLNTAGDAYQGWLVPDRLRSRWTLHRGTSRRILPGLLPRLRSVDIFLHDSLHTRSNIDLELRAVTPFLTERGVVIADDIEGNDAFHHWIGLSDPPFHRFVRPEGKPGLFGIAMLGSRPRADS